MRTEGPGVLAGVATLLIAAAAGAQTHTVTVNADGTYDPPELIVDAGDEVVWTFPDRHRAIVRMEGATATAPPCDAIAAWDPDAENPFTGPLPQAASGIVALGPNDGSRSVFDDASAPEECRTADNPFSHGGDWLCPDETLPPHHVLEEVLAHPGVSAVFIRFDWDEIEPEPGRYDFAELDAEIDRVIGAGKLYSLSFRAGKHGTPDWLGAELHMPLLQLRDGGSNVEEGQCGAEMFIPNVTDPAYGQRYAQMLAAVAEHLKENAARWRALAYVKPSGANLFTLENRLAKNCTPGCPICNTAVWAAAGYTPDALYEFYEDQLDAIAAHFPDKSMAYMLIQAGFPRVLDADHYEGCVSPGCDAGVPGGTLQTTEILDRGATAQGAAFIVEHNGLGPISEIRIVLGLPVGVSSLPSLGALDPLLGPQPWPHSEPQPLLINLCPTGGMHPPDPDPTDPPELREYTGLPGACPNAWVLFHGATGQYTGWQTVNTGEMNTLEGLHKTLRNAWVNSDGMFVELYEQLIWLAGREGGQLDPDGVEPLTLEEWDERFHERRADPAALGLPVLPEPKPLEHRHVFANTGSDTLTYWYTDPATCARDPATRGKIVVNP